MKTLGQLSPKILTALSGLDQISETASLQRKVWGLDFLNSVGLAAGFDKNAELVEFLPHLGFGFVEIGTVTPRAQPGNPKPRLFRDIQEQALLNRMGFNNDGAKVIASRLAASRPKLPKNFRVGVNLGKNKETSLEDAKKDYAEAAQFFESLADYFVVNVSSPNTANLRELQEFSSLLPIIEAVRNTTASWEFQPPLLVKFSPEFFDEADAEFWAALSSLPVDGLVLTNTLKAEVMGLPCGKSGRPLTKAARDILRMAKENLSTPIISVGGISSPEEAKERLRLGADLIQIYSAWVFEGPRLIPSILKSVSS
jgi:dihydroorotate dehydrogenase